MQSNNQNLASLLKRGVAEIIVEAELIKLLSSRKPLRLKQGFDPSAPDIHLGHVVGLRKLRQFQSLGHKVILIVGDWTAQIGDPSGELITRPMLPPQVVEANAQTYMKQFFKIVDKEKTEVRWQSEWYSTFNLRDIINLTSKFTVAQLLARDDFAKRYEAGRPLAITELLYPLLQAYDSVVIEADVEFGGIDQKFNCLIGRELQQISGQSPQQVFLVPLLIGTDGTYKMSKSLGNYIAIDAPPEEMYGKIMSIPDHLIIPYFKLITDVPDEEITQFEEELRNESVNPMILKKRLAREITTQFHSSLAAAEAEEHFTRVFQKRQLPEKIPEYELTFDPITIRKLGLEYNTTLSQQDLEVAFLDQKGISVDTVSLLVTTGMVRSRSEAKRLLNQGAIELDGKKVTETKFFIHDSSIVRAGKQNFLKLVCKRSQVKKPQI